MIHLQKRINKSLGGSSWPDPAVCLEINIVHICISIIYSDLQYLHLPTCSHGLCVVHLEAALGAGVPTAGVRPHVSSWTGDCLDTDTD